jgi:hypothetical protein
MALEEVAIICFSFLSCVGIVAIAYFLSEQKKEQMRQYGITQRAQMKLGTPEGNPTSPYGAQEWWVPLATELLKNPQVQNMIMSKVAPALQNQIKTE